MNLLLDSTTVTHSLEQSLQKTQSFLAALGTDADFTAKITLAFGNNFDTEIAKSLALDWANGDFEKLPSIEIRSSAEINGAKGAFAGANNTIYLSREFLDENSNNIDAIANVILEEIGHSIDWQLNNSDAPGDEGAIFSALVRGETLKFQQRQLLLAEDDSATITLDGEVLQIEQATTYTGDNLGDIITGFDALLDTLQAAVNNRVYGNKLPLLGDKLKNSAESGVQFISNFEDDILKKLHEKLDTAVTKTPELIKQALAEALGPNGLKLLPDLNNDGQVDAQEIDQAISFVETTDDVKFNLRLKKEEAANSFSTALDAGIGLPAFKLDINGKAKVGLGYDFNLDFGVNKTKGFYFDTSNANELKINFNASLPNLEATGKLGFLQLNVKDQGTQFNGEFTVDLKDSDNQLFFSELPSVNLANLVDAKLNGSANINLNAATSFQESAVLPSLSTDINIGWGFNSSNADPDNPSSFGDVPSIAFNNVQMDMGTFFSDFAKPILGKIKQVTDPIQPVIKVLEEPLPGFSDVRAIKAALDKDKDGNVTLLDIIETIGPAIDPDFNVRYIKAVTEIADLIKKLDKFSTSTDKLIVDLGSFNLGSTDIRSIPDLNKVSPSSSQSVPDIKSQLESKGATDATSFVSSFESSKAGQLQFPLLNDSTNAFKLLLGQTADLFTYDMPELKFKLGYSQFYPIIYILGARFSFDLSANIDLAFGFDTEGLKQFADSGKTGDIFNGFFVNDFRTNPDGTTEDVPEVSLTGGIGGSGELNAVVASAGVEASVRTEVDFDLDDTLHNKDGKVRVNKILEQIKEDPLCLFKTSGEVTAGLYAYYKFLGGREEIGLAKTPPLISFDSKCDDKTGLKLAEDVGGGVLRLNMGPNAGARIRGDLNDGNEIFTVSPDPNSGGVVYISAFESRQKHNVSSKIVGNGGAGNDLINIQAGVQTPADLSGEVGDDKLYYRGTGSATLHGGEGNDQLVGGAGSDELFGEGGDDNLKGGDNSDRLFGDDGSDRLSGEAGDDKILAGSGDDYLAGGAGADTLDGGEGIDAVSYISSGEAVSVDLTSGKSSGGDAAGDVLQSIEKLTGSELGDILSGSTQNDFIDGGGGNDAINGGDGNDTLIPGLGDDTIDGGGGTDQLVLDYSALPTRAVAWRDIDPTDPSSWDVFVGNAYGVGTPLTVDIGNSTTHYDVALSTDGTTVAWTDEKGLWVKKVGNSNPPFRINTVTNPNFHGSSLSADGSKVAWIDYRSQEADLFVANTDGTGITKITTFELGAVATGHGKISLSGDGKKVAWSGVVRVGESVLEEEIFVANTDGTGIKQITDDSATSSFFAELYDAFPSLSADGSKIVWQRSPRTGNAVIFVANTDGTGIKKLSDDTYGENKFSESAFHPSMSGDGSKVAWSSAAYVADSPNVLAMIRTGNTDGSGVVMVAGSENANSALSLAADGAKVAFVKDTDITDGKGSYGLFVGNADGTGIPTLIDIGNPAGGDSTWDFGGSVGDRPSLSTYVNVGIRYPKFDPITGSGEIQTWGPSQLHFSNIKLFKIIGTSYGDEIYGGALEDTLTGGGGADTIKAGLGNDTYELDAQKAAGSQIQDAGGTDILNLPGVTISLSAPAAGSIGIERDGTMLLVDLNKDGVANAANDLAILDFFAESVSGAGAGLIETVGNLSGTDILNYLNSGSTPTPTPTPTPNPAPTPTPTPTPTAEPSGGDRSVTLIGTNSNDLITGTPSNEIIVGKLGNDSLFGRSGNDLLYGNQGEDILNGNQGNDTLYGGKGNDLVQGGKDNDLVSGDLGDDSLFGDLGNDTVFGGEGNDLLNGNQGEDILNGNQGNDTVYGGKDNDVVHGGKDDDLVSGDLGNDTLFGDLGNDTVRGGAGDDLLSGGIGNDSLIGGEGRDRFVLTSGAGVDTITDFQTGQDLMGLAGGLRFEQLTISQGTGIQAQDTLIHIATTGDLLASLTGLSSSSITQDMFAVV